MPWILFSDGQIEQIKNWEEGRVVGQLMYVGSIWKYQTSTRQCQRRQIQNKIQNQSSLCIWIYTYISTYLWVIIDIESTAGIKMINSANDRWDWLKFESILHYRGGVGQFSCELSIWVNYIWLLFGLVKIQNWS